jgi:DNA-binding MarR family transcriptional regulator
MPRSFFEAYLEKLDLVILRPNPSNRSAKLVALTETGSKY